MAKNPVNYRQYAIYLRRMISQEIESFAKKKEVCRAEIHRRKGKRNVGGSGIAEADGFKGNNRDGRCHDQTVKITRLDGMILRENTYDSAGNLKSVLEGSSIYTEYAYNLAGNPSAVCTGRGNAARKTPAQTLSYDPWGNITGVEDGNRTRTHLNFHQQMF